MKDGKPWRVRQAEKLEAAKKAKASVKPHRIVRRLPPPNPRGHHVYHPHPPVTPLPKKRVVPEDHNPHLPRGIVPWAKDARPNWRDCVVHIVGGGPSLKDPKNVALLKEARERYPEHKWLVVNNSYKLVPWFDLLHFADCAWWDWNGKHVLSVAGPQQIITTATSDVGAVQLINRRVKRLWRNRNEFSLDINRLHGWDSGTQALNLAFLLGAKRIVCWGMDMCVPPGQTPQWHTEHRRATKLENYQKTFAPHFAVVVRELDARGVKVFRATDPGIPEAPYRPLDECCNLE